MPILFFFLPVFSFLHSLYIQKVTVCYKTHSKREKVIYFFTSSRREVWLPLSLSPESKNCLSLTLFIILLVFQYFVPIRLAQFSSGFVNEEETHFHQLSCYCNSRRNEPDLALLLKELTKQKNFPTDLSLCGILFYT